MRAGTFLTAEWRYLVMLNYEVEPKVLWPRLPSGTELDFFEGRTYVSIVGFLFQRTRVLGIPIPFHRNFEEVNLRFYVRRRADDGSWRRGVVFVREIVPKAAIAYVARTLYGEPYVRLPMRHEIYWRQEERVPSCVTYGWKHRGQKGFVSLESSSTLRLAAKKSLSRSTIGATPGTRMVRVLSTAWLTRPGNTGRGAILSSAAM